MKRPGKYSDNYGKTKRRLTLRRNLRVALAALVLFLIFFVPYLNSKVKDFHANGDTFPSQTIPVKSVAQTSTQPVNSVPPGTVPGTQTDQEMLTRPATQAATGAASTGPSASRPDKTQPDTTTPPVNSGPLKADFKLTNGSAISVDYEVLAPGEVKFLGVTGAEGEFSWDVSPSGAQLLINETADQNLILIGADLKARDHSFNTYRYAGNGDLRRDVYNKRAGFIWMRNARFFTEDLILFESQVALAMKPLYIWSYIPSAHKYKLIEGTRSKLAQLEAIDAAGFKVSLDGKTVHISQNLEVVK